MFCVKCGKELSYDCKFCTSCGTKIANQETGSNKIERKEYEFYSLGKGGKTKIIIHGAKLTISRPGALSKFSHGFVGEKTILIKNISSVQLKEVGMSGGYLQFVFPGSSEQKSGIASGAIGENIVYFDSGFNNKETNKNAREIKLYIENYNANIGTNNNITNVYNSDDKYDKLAKIKKLLDDGILSQEEFEQEKRKILNLN